MESVTNCTYFGNSVIAQAIDDKGVKRYVYCSDVRAGIIFPTGKNPGYYVLFGQERETVPTGKHILLFLSEGEDIMHESLFSKLTDDCTKYMCKTVYAHLPRTDRRGGVGGYDDLWRYLRNRRLAINTIPAPAAEDVEYGRALLREFLKDKAIDIPAHRPTILKRHLSQMTGDTKEEDVYAHSAMRYLLTGYVKYNQPIPFEAKIQKSPKANPRGWT